MNVPPLRWVGSSNGQLELLDQTLLPGQVQWLVCRDVATLWEAIVTLRVRGAPAIGIAAAYGVCLGVQPPPDQEEWSSEGALYERLHEVCRYLATSRPTAVNLFWALARMQDAAERCRGRLPPAQIRQELLQEAAAIHDQDRQLCRAIGRHGAELLTDGMGVLTHCNAGGLATSGYGTALAAIYTAHHQGKRLHVYVDETRPLLQGARLTSWELLQAGVAATLICDSMAGLVMREGRVQAVMTGADRIAANGDAANKVGTYSLAVLAHAHGIPFYVAAPTSTFDLALASGEGIPIEQRRAAEITEGFGVRIAPEGIDVYNPAFDVTPARYIRALITDRGLIEPVTARRVAEVLGDGATVAPP